MERVDSFGVVVVDLAGGLQEMPFGQVWLANEYAFLAGRVNYQNKEDYYSPPLFHEEKLAQG